ncbi:hypothetical protein YSY43_00990 [Paenibacillus sp. YSY-4.3]
MIGTYNMRRVVLLVDTLGIPVPPKSNVKFVFPLSPEEIYNTTYYLKSFKFIAIIRGNDYCVMR